MRSRILLPSLTALLWTATINAGCFDPSPAFPPPAYHSANPLLLEAFNKVQDSLTTLITSPIYSNASFSVQITSTQSTLWSSYHTAVKKNSTRPGAKEVQGDSAFRIASITKTFTTLALLQLHQAGKLSLDDPVDKYLPLEGTLPWKDITLRILASQLSGIPRDWSQGDLSTAIPEAWRFGLPPARPNNTDLPDCYSYSDHGRPCGEADLYKAVKRLKPIFAPNYKSTYSNMAFEVLGIVIAHVSGVAYEEYIQKNVLDTIGMNSTSFKVPPDKVAVLPNGNAWFWDVDEGIHNPTGGLYSTGDDLSLYLRYVLTHFNALATGVNWLQPHSFAFGTESFFGMPWEIFRTTKASRGSERPVTFYTKSGGEPGYLSIIIAVPGYGLGLTILVAGGDEEILSLIGELREIVTGPIIRAAEEISENQLSEKYAGTFVFENSEDTEDKLNSSLRLEEGESSGLRIIEFVSNGTEPFEAFKALQPVLRVPETRAQLIPTMLYVDEEKQEGERWKVLIVPPRKDFYKRGIWDEFCISNVDFAMYDGVPLNEVVFYSGSDGRIERVHMSAFRVTLKRQEEEKLLVQEL